MKNESLKEKEGKKIRRQYFNGIICVILSIMLYVPYCILIVNLLSDSFVLSEWLNSVKICVLVCLGISIPFIVLSILNHHLFGKIACVLNEHGMYYEDRFIYWCDIDKIEYTIATVGRHSSFSPCYAEIYTKGKTVFIKHAPLYLLFSAKKLRPSIKTKLSKFSVWCIVFELVVFLALPLLEHF